MTSENHHVFLEEPSEATLFERMETLQKWFDENAIKPTGFMYSRTSSGEVVIQLTFGSRDHASLFERSLCEIDQLGE